MSLRSRLSSLPPAESDAVLSAIWKTFAQSEAREALELAIQDLLTEADAGLLQPTTPADVRAFHAGAVSALRRLLTTITASVNFQPIEAKYESPEPEDDDLPGDDYYTQSFKE